MSGRKVKIAHQELNTGYNITVVSASLTARPCPGSSRGSNQQPDSPTSRNSFLREALVSSREYMAHLDPLAFLVSGDFALSFERMAAVKARHTRCVFEVLCVKMARPWSGIRLRVLVTQLRFARAFPLKYRERAFPWVAQQFITPSVP